MLIHKESCPRFRQPDFFRFSFVCGQTIHKLVTWLTVFELQSPATYRPMALDLAGNGFLINHFSISQILSANIFSVLFRDQQTFKTTTGLIGYSLYYDAKLSVDPNLI